MGLRWLVIDTCAASGGVALAEDARVVAEVGLPERTASAGLLEAVAQMLAEAGWLMADVGAVGVVSGPGSFTGVRVGLAAAKGLCEALGVPMAAVSRLEVLAEKAGPGVGFAVMDAGRGEVYVRAVENGREWLMGLEEFVGLAGESEVAVGEVGLVEKLSALELKAVELRAADALAAMQRALVQGGSDVAMVDANYVRGESQIYAKKAGA